MYCSAAGSVNVPIVVPDTVTQWIGSAICTDTEDGLGVSTPVTLTAFQPYSLKVDLPSMVAVRGEIISIEVSITNYLTSCLAVSTYRLMCRSELLGLA